MSNAFDKPRKIRIGVSILFMFKIILSTNSRAAISIEFMCKNHIEHNKEAFFLERNYIPAEI